MDSLLFQEVKFLALSGSLFNGLEDKRKNICDAAINIFKEKDFNKTTVSEIAEKAHVGKGTFYLYFESKLKLLDFLLGYGTEKLIEYVKKSIEKGENSVEKLEKAIDAQLEFYNYYDDFFSFFVREIWMHREGLREQVNKLNQDYIVIFQEILEEGIKRNEFNEVDTVTISYGLFGMLSISSLHWIVFSEEFPFNVADISLKKVIFKGILKNE